MARKGEYKNITGQRFGRLIALELDKDRMELERKNGVRSCFWKCLCDCGNEVSVNIGNLSRGTSQSCGCLAEELRLAAIKKYNSYDLSGDYGIGYDSKGNEFYFDLSDYEKIKNYCWTIDNKGYVSSKDGDKRILMHDLLENPDIDNGVIIDHQDGRCNNNIRKNLRKANYSQNAMNRKILCNNTTGVTGVVWHKRDSIWEAYIGINNEKIYIGRYVNFDDAVAARKAAEEKYFGEWSYDNSRKE